MRTPKEMKDGLKRCLQIDEEQLCEGCPYEKNGCRSELMEDMWELIDAPAKYTAFEIIRLVQRAVSDEVCAMDVSDAAIGYEIERSIIGKLVKEDGCEANV